MVFEPNAHDGELFHTNAFSFAARRRVCQLAWRNTIDDLRLRADELRPVLAANGIRLGDEVLDDDSRTLLDGLAAPPPPSTDTSARLSRALDATERGIARRTTTRKRARSDERHVGKEGVSAVRSRWAQKTKNKKPRLRVRQKIH